MSIEKMLKEKRQARKKLAEQTSEIVTKVAAEKRAWTPAETEQWEKRHVDIDELGAEITRLEKEAETERHLAEPAPDTRTAGREDVAAADHAEIERRASGDPNPAKPDQWQGLRKLALHGGDLNCLSPVERRHFVFSAGELGCMERAQVEGNGGRYGQRSMPGVLDAANVETRAMGGSASAGDAMIPQGFVYTLNVALKWYNGIINEDVCTYLDTTLGNLMPYPNVDDTGNTGEITAENSQVAGGGGSGDTDPTFSAVNLSAWMYDSGVVLVPIQLIQDAAFNVESYLTGSTDVNQPRGKTGLLAIRIGRKLNADCTNGTGSNQPNGILTAAPKGYSGASPTTVAYNELVELEHSIDPAYRGSDAYGMPIAKFMFADGTLKAIKKLADSNNRPLWIAGGVSEGVQNRRPDMVDGFQFVINQDMPALGSSNKPILFGDFKKYVIRRVRGLEMFTFRERYMPNLQLGFLAYQRFDGQLLTAGNPVKYFQNSAT